MTRRWRVRHSRGIWWAESEDHIEAVPFTTWQDAYTYAETQVRQEQP